MKLQNKQLLRLQHNWPSWLHDRDWEQTGDLLSLANTAHSKCLQGPLRDVYKAALGLGTANQLTNILRDVGEDATERNRIYVPMEELSEFGISENEVCSLSWPPSAFTAGCSA